MSKNSALPKFNPAHSERAEQVPVNFFLGGAPKTGTMSLHNCLDQHPDITMGIVKESYFFNINWQKGVEWYASHHTPDNCHNKRPSSWPFRANSCLVPCGKIVSRSPTIVCGRYTA